MKNLIRNIMLFMVLATASLQAMAFSLPHDTVYFYNTWEQLLIDSPATMYVDPWIDPITPYEVIIETPNEKYNDDIWNKHIAAVLGDSIWLINSEYLQREFKGDAKNLNAYVPFYFNDKVAFAVTDAIPSVKELLLGLPEDAPIGVEYYYIDFRNRKVLRVTPEVLSRLLEDYHDLQMRYEGMKDYKKRPVIEDFFFQFVDRATEDLMRPFILDLTD